MSLSPVLKPGRRGRASLNGASGLRTLAHRLTVAQHPLARVGDTVDLVLQIAHGARHACFNTAVILNRFALAMALQPAGVRRHLHLGAGQAREFLRGETLSCAGPAGWTLVTMGDWPLGWGRVSGGALKSQVPRSLRAMVL